jgi:hypothetical protein
MPEAEWDIARARIMLPMAMIMVDRATPMSNRKLPVAEVLLYSNALSRFFHSGLFQFRYSVWRDWRIPDRCTMQTPR